MRALLAGWPVSWGGVPRGWLRTVNAGQADRDLTRVRLSVGRGRPLGDAASMASTADRLDLEATLRPRGRPRRERPA
ncbi:MAG: hypothetical protein AAGK09_05475 [Planctomycetota bacterium]